MKHLKQDDQKSMDAGSLPVIPSLKVEGGTETDYGVTTTADRN
jgi:hypothetical protein